MRFGPVEHEQLHQAFQEAFSDYVVDQSYLSEERLRTRLVKNGYSREHSVGTYEEGRLVGFTLIGLGSWKGERSAYDIATGIVPSHRGRKLAGRMFDEALPGLASAGVTRFQLEVIRTNEPAISAYRRQGFRIERELHCFRLDLGNGSAGGAEAGIVHRGSMESIRGLRDEVDWTPSWENSFEAMERIAGELIVFSAGEGGEARGVIVYAPSFNWILNLTVRRPDRRRGLGSALAARLARELYGTTSWVKLNNVDGGDGGMIRFLASAGFEPTVRQYEMARAV